jgi:Ca-activated chloride channel family protein
MFGITFAHADLLWALALLPALWLLRRWALRRRLAAVHRWTGGAPLEPGTARAAGSLTLVLLVIIAAAGPAWGTADVRHERQGRDLLVVLDVSRSMLAEDGGSRSRLARARRLIEELLSAFERQGRAERVALVVFTGQGRSLSPFTFDYDSLRFALRRAGPDLFKSEERLTRPTSGEPASGTSWSAAVTAAAKLFDLEPSPVAEVLFISDGDDEEPISAELLGPLRERGLRLHVLGMGDAGRAWPIPSGHPEEPFLVLETTPAGARERVLTRRRDERLSHLAQLGGGAYLPESDGALVRWWHENLRPLPGRRSMGERQTIGVPGAGWIIGLLLLLTLLPDSAGRAGNPRSVLRASQSELSGREARTENREWAAGQGAVALALLFLLGAAAGSEGEALERGALERGQQAYGRGDWQTALAAYTEAAATTADPGMASFNQAACLYQLGRWSEAGDAYRRALEDATGMRAAASWYGRGNCLAQLGARRAGPAAVRLLEDALYAYSEALRELEEVAKADFQAGAKLSEATEFNRAAVAALLEQKRKEPAPPESQPGGRLPDEAAEDEWEGARASGRGSRPARPSRKLPSERAAGEGPEGEGPEGEGEEGARLPGAGDLPLVPESPGAPPLKPEEAERLLHAALERLAQLRRLHGAGPAILPPDKRDY